MSDELKPQSIGDDQEFRVLLGEFAYRASERRAMGGDFGSAEADEIAEDALIAHINAWGARLAGVPEGWQMVPINPTPAMLAAARNAPLPLVLLDSMSAQQDLMTTSRYTAMLFASPTPYKEPPCGS